jgi:predicted metal-dependent peptidase
MDYDYQKLDRDLDKVKSQLFLGNSAAFLAPIMCSLEFSWNHEIETCDTDGLNIRWNPKDFLSCTFEGRVSSLLHEIGHVYRLHPLRCGNRCPDIWNIACDIVINRDLRKMGYKLDNGAWAIPGISDMYNIPFDLEEQIYDHLNKPGSPKPQSGKCCGGILPLDPAGKQQLVNNVIKAAHTATVNGQAGAIPGGIQELIESFLKPKVNWRSALYRWFTELLDEDYSWRRPNRRYEDMYLPSRFQDEGRLKHLFYYFDISGSVSDKMLKQFHGDVKYIWDYFKPERLTLVTFDTTIHDVFEFVDGDSLDKLKVTGRGGTHFREVRQHIMDNKASSAIIFSDMECAAMKPGPTCPILWIVCNNKDAKVPFGKMIHIKV